MPEKSQAVGFSCFPALEDALTTGKASFPVNPFWTRVPLPLYVGVVWWRRRESNPRPEKPAEATSTHVSGFLVSLAATETGQSAVRYLPKS